jgi:hypothetical protein
VLVTGLKPSDDGKALIIRLFGAGGKTRSVKLRWGSIQPSAVSLTDTGEKPGVPIRGAVSVPGSGLVSLRAEFGD